MRSFSRYWDKFGLLVQKPPKADGGDGAQRLGMFYYGHYLLNKPPFRIDASEYDCNKTTFNYLSSFEQKLALIHDGSGNFRRHPDSSKWYSDWNRMSRDQMTPLIICMGAYKLKRPLLLSLYRLVSRLGFMNNTRRNFVYENEAEHLQKAKSFTKWNYSWKLPDIAVVHFPLYIRSFRAYLLWPLLFIFDIELLLGAITKVFIKTSSIKSGDDLNYILRSLQAKETMPTPFSWIARRIYKKFRPHMNKIHPSWIAEYHTDSGPQSALQFYCLRNDANDPPLDLLYNRIVEEM